MPGPDGGAGLRLCQPPKVLTADKGIVIASRACGVVTQEHAQVLPLWIAAPKPARNDRSQLGSAGQNFWRLGLVIHRNDDPPWMKDAPCGEADHDLRNAFYLGVWSSLGAWSRRSRCTGLRRPLLRQHRLAGAVRAAVFSARSTRARTMGSNTAALGSDGEEQAFACGYRPFAAVRRRAGRFGLDGMGWGTPAMPRISRVSSWLTCSRVRRPSGRYQT